MVRNVWDQCTRKQEAIAVTTSPHASHALLARARFASGTAGTTEVPGVWVAANATDLAAQVGASAAAGAHINSMLATADTNAALAATQGETPAL